MLHMYTAGLTDTGRVRRGNEDAFLIRDSLLIVADGMGGAAAGEVASSLAVNTIASLLEGIAPDSGDGAEDALRTAIRRADDQIRAAAERDRDLAGMGTTVAAALMFRNQAVIGYVGDSRVYLVSGRNGKPAERIRRPAVNADAQTVILPKIDPDAVRPAPANIRRLTDDHSVVMNLVQAGIITEDDIRTHPLRNRITRCVGSVGGQDPEFRRFTPRDGDVLILCSDGLWEMVHEDLILAVVSSTADPREMCRRLISAANDAGGHDNITVIAAVFSE